MEKTTPIAEETAADPDRPIEGWWLKIFCAFGWHRRFVHPHNIIVEASTPATTPDDQPLNGKGISPMTLRNMSKLTTTELAEEAHRAAVALDHSGAKVEGDLAVIVAEMADRLVLLENKVRSIREPDS